jgi:hypothetical protein
MSARWRAPARPPSAGLPLRLSILALLVLLAGALLVHATSAADPPPATRRLDPADARRAGVALELVAHPELPARVLEVRPQAGSSFAGVVLEAAPDGGSVALADALGDPGAGLVLAHADGSQLRVELDGVIDATFAGDAASLAVVDGAGRLWRVDVGNGAAEAVADGPFIGAPVVQDDGTILALAVPSVEAPFRSRLTRVSPDGALEPISDESLVYGAAPLADGSLAVIAHRPQGTAVLRLQDGAATLHADLGPDAVNVSLSADGGVIAWESGGRAFARARSGEVLEIGSGARPQVTRDGSAVLLEREGQSVLVDLEGRVLASLPAAAVIGCEGGCAS